MVSFWRGVAEGHFNGEAKLVPAERYFEFYIWDFSAFMKESSETVSIVYNSVLLDFQN